MTAADRAALVAWVMAGDDPDEPPRIDTAVRLAYAQPHTRRPSWWSQPGKCPNAADYWPQVGPEDGTYSQYGLPRPAIYTDAQPAAAERRPNGRSGKPIVTWSDILAVTYSGDFIADVARRLDMAPSSLRMRRSLDPAKARQMDRLRGIMAEETSELVPGVSYAE